VGRTEIPFLYFPPHGHYSPYQKKNAYPSPVVFYLYNGLYYFNFTSPLTGTLGRINSATNTIFFNQLRQSPDYTHYINALRGAFRSVTSVFFYKMKFKGKGYYVYKNARNTIAPQFGYYHRIYVYAYNISVKFLSKTSVLLFGLSKSDLLTVGHNFRSKKPINIFTGRGVRFARQVVYKKTGKVSSYR
jgi:ribosomal protein L6P/L9E